MGGERGTSAPRRATLNPRPGYLWIFVGDNLRLGYHMTKLSDAYLSPSQWRNAVAPSGPVGVTPDAATDPVTRLESLWSFRKTINTGQTSKTVHQLSAFMSPLRPILSAPCRALDAALAELFLLSRRCY